MATKILWATATTARLYPRRAFKAEKFVPQISGLGSCRRVGRLHQSRLQIHIALGSAAAHACRPIRCSSERLPPKKPAVRHSGTHSYLHPGMLVRSQPGATSQKTEPAADTNVPTFTPQAAAGTYRLRFVISVSAASAATLGWTATWTDSNGNAQTPTNLSLVQSGTAAPALTFTTSAAGNYYGDATIDVNNARENIVMKLTFSGTSFTAKVSATVGRLQ